MQRQFTLGNSWLMFPARPFRSSSINGIFEYYDRIHCHFLRYKD